MSKSYLRIYLILVLYIMTEVKYGILQLAGTTEALPSQKHGTTTEAFHLQLNRTTETFPPPLNGKTEAPSQNGTTTEAFHLQHNGTAETFPSTLNEKTETSPLNGTTTEAFHLQHNGTAETFPSPLNGKTEAPPLNGTTTGVFHLQHNGTAETFPSPLNGKTEASPLNGTTTRAFHLQHNGTAETFPSPLNGKTEASPLNGTTTEAFHLQHNGTAEKFPPPLNVKTEAPPQNGSTTEAFHLQLNRTTITFPPPLNGKIEAPSQNGSTTEAFHLQLNGTAETFPSPLDATTEAFPSRHGTPGMTEPLDTTRGVTVWNHVPSENGAFQFCLCEKLGEIWCYDVEDLYKYSTWDAPPVTVSLGLCMKFLRINDPQFDLDEEGLEGILFLEEFTVKRSALQTIPDFSFVKGSVRIIKIEWSRLSSLEGTQLQNLASVTHLSFSQNAIWHMHPDVFQGTENVEHLDLSYNLLTSIPEALLDPMKHLNTFAASHNNLLHVNYVFAVTLPKVILLDFNKLTNANDVLTFTHDRYQELKASRAEVGWNRYLPFWEVNRLDLSHNRITESDKSLLLPDSYIMNGVPVFRIERLLLDGNQLRNLDNNLGRCRVVEFRASQNRLQDLYVGDFSTVHDTVDLILRDNEIRGIHPFAFMYIQSTLQRLDLSCNSIPHLNGSVRYLSELRTLDVSYNAIQSFSEDEFTGLLSLSELYLQHNQIRVLAQLQHLPRLWELDISHNHIQLIRPQQLPPYLGGGRAIKLGDNLFNCDCRLQPFTDWARGRYKGRDFVVTSPELCLRSDVGNRKWESEECPDLCTCSCRNDFMFVDCSSKSLIAIPPFLRKVEGNKTVDSDVVMRQNRDPVRHFEDRVRGINLENNSLESLEGAHLPPNLTLLYLAHNKLRRLPDALITDPLELKEVSLSGNPWRCDCSTVTFKKWLTSNKEIFQDLDAISCGPDEKESVAGRAVWQLTDLDLCPSTPIRLIVSVAFGILTFIIVCLSAKLLFARYELNIRVFLYNHGLTFAREEDIDQDKLFDVFVSFSHADDEFVIRDIIPVIEKKDPEIRLCLHYRHFIAGEFILDNITRAVHSSKRTLLILTRNFLESEWCLQEFRTAHRQSMVDKVHRIVAVKVGELPKKIDPTLQVYLDCTTYLVWGEVNFWNKLLFVLPTRNAGKNQNVIEDCPDL